MKTKKSLNKKNIKTIFSASVFAVLTFLAIIPFISADADDIGCGGYGMMSGFYGGSGFMILSWITTILIIALIVAAIYWLIKSANKKR